MKVTKKDEKLARSLLWTRLYTIGFPKDRIDDRVDAAWPGELEKAKYINLYINSIDDGELDGITSEEDIKQWSDD